MLEVPNPMPIHFGEVEHQVVTHKADTLRIITKHIVRQAQEEPELTSTDIEVQMVDRV
jgi:hypothetical protein